MTRNEMTRNHRKAAVRRLQRPFIGSLVSILLFAGQPALAGGPVPPGQSESAGDGSPKCLQLSCFNTDPQFSHTPRKQVPEIRNGQMINGAPESKGSQSFGPIQINPDGPRGTYPINDGQQIYFQEDPTARLGEFKGQLGIEFKPNWLNTPNSSQPANLNTMPGNIERGNEIMFKDDSGSKMDTNQSDALEAAELPVPQDGSGILDTSNSRSSMSQGSNSAELETNDKRQSMKGEFNRNKQQNQQAVANRQAEQAAKAAEAQNSAQQQDFFGTIMNTAIMAGSAAHTAPSTAGSPSSYSPTIPIPDRQYWFGNSNASQPSYVPTTFSTTTINSQGQYEESDNQGSSIKKHPVDCSKTTNIFILSAMGCLKKNK